MDCPICAMTYTSTLREKVDCYSCGFTACKTCVRTYLLTSNMLPQCMNCHTKYSLYFIVRKLNRSWVLSKLRSVTTQNLLQKYKILIHETMTYAEAEKEKRRYKEKRAIVQSKIHKLQDEIDRLSNESYAYTCIIRGDPVPDRYRVHVEGDSIKIDERKKFIMACTQQGCKGFLSTAYKCALCNQYTCPDCLVILGQTRNPDHVCVESDKLSAELIKKETKPCPTCGERIYKVSGCDQMFCTQCHTAFSWKTGQIEKGTIHNPHFYEMQRLNGTAIRNVGDVPCGGMPDIRHLIRTMEKVSILLPIEVKEDHGFSTTKLQVQHAHRRLTELVEYEVNTYRTRIRDLGNTRHLLVAYILNDITETELSNAIYKNNYELQKNTDIYHVMELMSITGVETYIDIMSGLPSTEKLAYGGIDGCVILICELNDKLEKLDKVRVYCNDQLKELSITYNCTVPVFEYDCTIVSKKFNISTSSYNTESKAVSVD